METSTALKIEKPPLKRIIALDFLRGAAMLGVLGFHLLSVTYDYEARFDLDYIPIAYYFLVAVLAFAGSLFPAFILTSAIGNTISMDKKWHKLMAQDDSDAGRKRAFSKLLKMQVSRGLFLIIADYFIEIFLNGMLNFMVIPESWERIGEKMLSELYHFQILAIIGVGVILTAVVYLWCQNKQVSKKSLTKTLAIVGAIFILGAPLINIVFNALPGLAGNPNRTLADRTLWLNILYFFISPLANGWYPIFPNAALFFIGTIIAINFTATKKFFQQLTLASIGFLFLGIIWMFVFPDDRWVNDMLIPTAGSLFLLVILIYFIDIRGKGTNFAKNKIVLFLRRFGNLSLTIWALQWLMTLYLRLIQWIVDGTAIAFIDSRFYRAGLTGNQTWALFFGMLPLWGFFLWGWEHVNYKGSLEWLFARVIVKKSGLDSSKVDLRFALHNIESIIPAEEGQKWYKPWEFVLIFGYLLLLIVVSVAALLL